MKVLVGSLVLVLAIAAAYAVESPAYNYHLKTGIPKAAQIKKAEENAAKERIAGGSNVHISQVPYQAGLIIQLIWIMVSVCGGSLISNDRVLTAAHCHYDGLFQARAHTVVLGSSTVFSGGIRQQSKSIVMHPEWNPDTIANDIAVISIDPVQFTANIQPISLPTGDYVNNDFVGRIAIASGFGVNDDDTFSVPLNQVLSWVEVPIISNGQCADFYGNTIIDTSICISGEGGKSTCTGDSGGPLAVKDGDDRILVGVTSFGYMFGCTIGAPTAFARVKTLKIVKKAKIQYNFKT